MSEKNQTVFEQYEKCVVPIYEPAPDIVFTEAEGVWLHDTEGNQYLDCLAGYSALNQGHSHPDIVQALVRQAHRLTLTTRGFYNDKLGDFLTHLCNLAQMDKAIPMNSGAEAVETALKVARKWGYDVKNIDPDMAEIIVCHNNFHGRTLSIVSFSSSKHSTEGFSPLTPGFKIIPFGDIEALQNAITPHTVGFLVEPIQGEAGVLIPPNGYLRRAREICQQHNVLFMVDEIQTGFGRTGKLFAHTWDEGATPDLMMVGKALSGGLYPISALLGRGDVLSVMTPGTHGSTYGGNPLAAAVAIAAMKVVTDEDLSQRSKDLGAYFLEQLKEISSPNILSVRGRGLMMAIDLNKASYTAKDFCRHLLSLGVLTKETRTHTIRISPPLVISKAEIDWAIARFRLAFEVMDGKGS